jgi:hypothetical protein
MERRPFTIAPMRLGETTRSASQLVDADPEWFHEVFQENLSGMDWIE